MCDDGDNGIMILEIFFILFLGKSQILVISREQSQVDHTKCAENRRDCHTTSHVKGKTPRARSHQQIDRFWISIS